MKNIFVCEPKKQGCPHTHSGLNKHSDALIRNKGGQWKNGVRFAEGTTPKTYLLHKS